MKLAIVLMIVFIAIALGCANREVTNRDSYGTPVTQMTGELAGGVFRVVDTDNSVICYVSDGYNSGGISCVKKQ